MNKKIIAFIEPSFYGVSFVKAALDLGHKIIVIVPGEEEPRKYGYDKMYDDLIIADIRDEESILEAIKKSKYYGKLDALIPATDYVLHITSRVAEKLGLKCMQYEAAEKARNKDLARESYAKHNVPSVRFKKVRNYSEAKEAIKEIGFPVVVKPANCASSQNVFYVENYSNLENAVNNIINLKTTYMGFDVKEEFLIEEYIKGQEFSVELFLKDKKKLFAAVTEKVTSQLPYFVETAHVLPTSVYEDRKDEIIQVAVLAANSLGIYDGPTHVEIRISKTGPKIIELNGRPGGDNISSDLLPNALGVDVFKSTINYYLDNEVNMIPTKCKATSIAYLTAEKDGIVSKINGLNNLENNRDLIRYDVSVKPGDRVQIPQSSDDRLGYVIVKGDTPKEAKKIAADLIEKIEIVYK